MRRLLIHRLSYCVLTLIGMSSPAALHAQDTQTPPQHGDLGPDDEVVTAQDDTIDEDDEDVLPVLTVETRALADRGAMSGSAQRVEQIDADALERRGATNLAEALEWLSAGSSASPSGTTQGLIIDGLPTSQVIVLRDGLPLTRPAGSQQGPIIDLSAIAINPQTIKRIDVYRGSGPVGSGSAGGVIIDIVTRRPEPGTTSSFLRAQTAAQFTPTLPFSRDLMGGVNWGSTRELSMGATALYSQSDAVDVDGDENPDMSAARRANAELTWAWRPSSNDFLRFMVIANASEATNVGGPQDIFDDIIDRQIYRLRAQGRWWLGDDVRLDHNLDIGLEQNRFRKRVRSSDFLRLKSDTTLESARQIVTATRFTERHDLAGEVYASGWQVARVGETGSLPKRRQGELGAGLADTFYANDTLEIFARGVAESSSAYGAGLNGQLSISYMLIPSIWVMRTTMSSTRRVPTPEELYLDFDHAEVGYRITGNPDLEPERLYSAQLSSVWNTKNKRFGLETQGFIHELDNTVLISTIPGTDALFSYENGGRARVIGGQVQLQFARLVADIDLLGNYTFLPFARDLDTEERLPQRARHAGRVELRRRWLNERLELWTDVSARSGFAGPIGSPPATSNLIWGVGGRFVFNPQWNVLLDANNLLDQTDTTWGPQPGRYMLLSVNWQARRAKKE